MSILIREATIEDAEPLLSMVHKLAAYEKKKPEDVKLSLDKIKKHGFSERPYFQSLIVECDGQAVGYALYYYSYAASAGAPAIFLEDIFVEEAYRHRGIGKGLFAELAAIAVKLECCRLEWNAFTWNEKAIEFYKSLGAIQRGDVFQFRLLGEGLVRMAESNVTLY